MSISQKIQLNKIISLQVKLTFYIFLTVTVIACKPQFPSYISALLPQDQIFEPEPEFEFETNPGKKKKEAKNDTSDDGILLYF